MSVDDIIVKLEKSELHRNNGKEYIFRAFLKGKEIGQYIFTYDPGMFSNFTSQNIKTFVSFITMNKGYHGKGYSKKIMKQSISKFKGIVKGKTLHLVDMTRIIRKSKNSPNSTRYKKIHASFERFFIENGYTQCDNLNGMINSYGKNFRFF
ncbi:MAG: hypothetical protein ABH828_03785 [archaeon]